MSLTHLSVGLVSYVGLRTKNEQATFQAIKVMLPVTEMEKLKFIIVDIMEGFMKYWAYAL